MPGNFLATSNDTYRVEYIIICTRFLTKTIKQIATQNISNRTLPKKKSTKLSDKNNIKQIFKHNKSTKFSDKKKHQKKNTEKRNQDTAMAFPSAVAASIDLPFFSASKASYWLMVQKSHSNNHRVRMVKTL